jgi:SAM-dependent methyltransferase
VNAHDLASGVAPTRLFGFDEDGEVFDLGDLILRRIRESRKADVAAVHRTYERARLAAKGIVETRLRSDGDLEHRKLVVSYPYEWPANMYKDAVLFHLRLIAALDSDGLTLKDALPNNILFDHTRPVFVDFLSLVPRERLAEAAWLGAGSHADPRFVVARKMLLPYMILPLLFMARGAYRIARDLLSWRSCNCEGEPPSWLELLAAHGRPSRTWLRRYLRSLRIAAELLPARYWTRRRKPDAFDSLLTRLLEQVRSLDVTPPLSAYSYYYDEKKEEISFDSPGEFPPKQRAVHGLLRAKAPRTVLDLGANTGWYSVLAAREGASVIALEEDESCVDILYGRAKRQDLSVLPLKLAFGELTRAIHGARALGGTPLYRAGVERLRADLVLVLGLLHHLVLGEGRSIEDVFATLSRLAERTLVVEFVSLDDEKIREDPAFFPNLLRFDVGTYNLDLVREAGLRHFAKVEVQPSHPGSRTLLVFDR